jgi:transposase-like protein
VRASGANRPFPFEPLPPSFPLGRRRFNTFIHHFEDIIIVLCVQSHLRYSLSYRDLEEMMLERELSVDHTTVWRWVQERSVYSTSSPLNNEQRDSEPEWLAPQIVDSNSG